jgi:MFS transporter, DHA1 family, tetracycline resistance protein
LDRLYHIMQPKQPSKISLFPILMVNFIGAMGFSIVLPFMAIIVLKFGGNALVYGALGATYSFLQLIGAPVLGKWSDNVGRKKILLICQAGTFFGWIIFLIGIIQPNHFIKLFGFLISIPLILIFTGRSLDGITGGNISVANAYLADITPKAERKKNFGRMAAAANLGLIFGPLIAGALGATGLGNKLPVMAAAFISLVAIVVIFYGLKNINSQAVENENGAVVASQNVAPSLVSPGKSTLMSTLKLPYVGFFMLLYFLIFLAFNFFYVAFPVYVAGDLHWTVLQIGVFFSVLSGMLVVMQGPVLSWLAKKVSSAILVIAGAVLLSAGFAFFSYPGEVMIYTGAVFFSIGNGVMWPSFMALLSNTGDADTQGAIQGFAGSAGSLASITGLITGGFLYHSMGANLFLFATVFMLLIGLVSLKLIKIEKALG